MSKSNAEIARHPLAIAWDDWLTSDEGQKCADVGSLTMGESPASLYLINRLRNAFLDGAATAQSDLARKVLEHFEEGTKVIGKDHAIVLMRDLFTRLGIEIGGSE